MKEIIARKHSNGYCGKCSCMSLKDFQIGNRVKVVYANDSWLLNRIGLVVQTFAMKYGDVIRTRFDGHRVYYGYDASIGDGYLYDVLRFHREFRPQQLARI